MPKANIGDAEIYYEEHGKGEPLMLVSGLGGTALYWKANLPALSAKYRVIVHDHRGAGQSTHSKMQYTVDQMTDDTVKLMDHLKIDSTHVVGHSTGGAIGQTMAIQHPERLKSMVLFATWTKADFFFRHLFSVRRDLLTRVGKEAYVKGATLFLYPPWWIRKNEKMIAEREALTIQHFPPVEVVASRIDGIVAFDRSTELGKIKTPTLVLCAKDDAITPVYFSEDLAKKIPGAKLKILSDGGHCASEAVAQDFNSAVLEFLSSQR
jgi:aminoacrylate hydrolase